MLNTLEFYANYIPRLLSQRPLPHAGGIRKRNFISTVGPTVHTNPSRLWSFSKTLLKPEEFENAGFSFRVDGKHFENEALPKR